MAGLSGEIGQLVHRAVGKVLKQEQEPVLTLLRLMVVPIVSEKRLKLKLARRTTVQVKTTSFQFSENAFSRIPLNLNLIFCLFVSRAFQTRIWVVHTLRYHIGGGDFQMITFDCEGRRFWLMIV